MAYSEEDLNFILDQLSDFGTIEVKKMFGGVGIFKEGRMFAMIGYGKFRLKVDDSNKAEYLAAGMKELYVEGKKKSMPYWEVPADILENKDELMNWAKKSFEIALKGKK